MHDRATSTRKAAILVASADRQTAELLLQQMPAAEAAAVRRAAIELDDVDPDEQAVVLSEFRQLAAEAPPERRSEAPRIPDPQTVPDPPTILQHLIPNRRPAGIDLCGPEARLLQVRADDQVLKLPGQEDTPESPLSSTALRWLHQAGSEALAEFLGREHPQTIAVVFSRLAPAQAAEVLMRLPAELQAGVVRRLTDLDETDPEILAEVERGLASWLSEQIRRSQRRGAGLSAVVRILDATQQEGREAVLTNLARFDVDLSLRLSRISSPTESPAPRRPALRFDDLLQLDDATLAAIVATADREVAILALAGAGVEALARVAPRLAPADAAALRRGVANLGPTRLSDVEASQRNLVELALELEAESRIDLSSLRPLDIAA